MKEQAMMGYKEKLYEVKAILIILSYMLLFKKRYVYLCSFIMLGSNLHYSIVKLNNFIA